MELKPLKKEISKITTIRLTKKAEAAFRAITADRSANADENFVWRGLLGRTVIDLIHDAHEIFKMQPLDLRKFAFDRDRIQRCVHLTKEEELVIDDLKKLTGSVSLSTVLNYILESDVLHHQHHRASQIIDL
jgi:hypothetical protein